MDTKGLMGIDIHVQYRKIIKLGRNRRIHFTIPPLLPPPPLCTRVNLYFARARTILLYCSALT